MVVPTLDPEDTHYAVAEPTGHVYVADGGLDHIDRFDRSGRLDLQIHLTSVNHTPDRQRLTVGRAQLLERLGRRGMKAMEGAVDEIAANEDAPSFRALVTDDRERLWVKWGQQPNTAHHLYAVFDNEGVFAGTVRLPPHERILDIAGDRIVLVHRSPLDIETLAVYRFAEGSGE